MEEIDETPKVLKEAVYEIDLDNKSAFSMVNGAYFTNQDGVELVGLQAVGTDNGEYFHAKVIIKQSHKIGEVMDRIPFGILNKTITGLGATTLEIMNQQRNSIIVVPTKSLAYTKYKSANAVKGDGYAFYVGSPIKDITGKVSPKQIQEYLHNSAETKKKFLVVADSLPLLINVLVSDGIDVYQDYFLMVDEIDTMQADSAYRPKLENVIDYYFMFDKEHRSAVSATISDFSNPNLELEPRITTCWANNPRRNINLVYTNYVDGVAKNLIIEKLESNPDDKILVAYNSLDGILNIMNMLKKENIALSSDFGILCSERSNDKVKEYLENVDDVIDKDAHLQKKIVFMTCAYFAGIDILDQCHLITISSHLQPFTYLSTQRMAQIAGRCRNGNLSETIIYDIPQYWARSEFRSKCKYQSALIGRAMAYAHFLNATRDVTIQNPELRELESFINSFVDFTAKAKVDNNDYPIKIVRQNHIDKTFVPAYFNIDALVDKWELLHSLYTDEQKLENELRQEHDVNKSRILIEENDTSNIAEIKERNAERRAESVERLKPRLLEWHEQGRNDARYNEILREQEKKVQDLCSEFKKLSLYIDPDKLFDDLAEKYEDWRTLRNYVNAVVFHVMSDEHAFKADVLAKFHYHEILSHLGQRGIGRVIKEDKIQKMREVFRVQLNKTDLDDNTLAEFFSCFFKTSRSGGIDKIIGLNPLDLPVPIWHISPVINLFDLFLFPR